MRKIVFFALLSILTSCTHISDQSKPALTVDRVRTVFKNFKYRTDSVKDSVEYTLARGSNGDTLQYWFYIENKEKLHGIGFYVKDGRFKYACGLIPEILNSILTPMWLFPTDSLVAIDTIQVSIRENRFTLYKYEYFNSANNWMYFN